MGFPHSVRSLLGISERGRHVGASVKYNLSIKVSVMSVDEKSGRRLIIGFQEEWQDFERRNAIFLDRFPILEKGISLAFSRDVQLSEPFDKFVLLFGRVCYEDFSEILLCCGNGNGQAAQKLLRGLYERAVTLRFLQENPSEFDDFFDFFHISQRKLMIVCRQTIGEEIFPTEMADDIEKNFAEVKGNFMVTDCQKCGTKRLNHTWSKLDFAAMASKTSLGKLIVPGYFLPLRQAHATVASMLSRMAPSANNGISFVDAAQRKEADNALRVSHNIFLDVLRVQDEHFAVPGLKEQNEICLQEFMNIWRNGLTA